MNLIQQTIIVSTLISGVLSQAAEKPNIVFILADDLGWLDVGFNGSKYFETPNLDRLAKKSIQFSNAYMYPTCSPSRAAILSGKQSFRTQCYTVPVLEKGKLEDNVYSRWTVEQKHKFFSEPLNQAGYKLIHLGKWHVVGPNPDKEKKYPFKKKLTQPASGVMDWQINHLSKYQQYYPTGKGFHENVGGTWWGDPARGYKKGYKSASGGYRAPFKNPYIETKKDGDKWLTDRLTTEAIDFIKRHKKESFFVNLHFYAPHRPSVAFSPENLQKYMNKKGGTNGQLSNATPEIAAYATMVERVDHNVGRIVDYLEKNELDKNTVIVFTSDNGFNSFQSFNNGLRGNKGQIYEGGIKVPFLISLPNHKHKLINEPICGLDLFPTFLDIAGVLNSYKETLDGETILPIIQRQQTRKSPLYWHIASNYKTPACSAIRDENWKLIQWHKTGDVEVYNLAQDPSESENLANKKFGVTKILKRQLINWQKENQVPFAKSSVLNNTK